MKADVEKEKVFQQPSLLDDELKKLEKDTVIKSQADYVK